MNEHSETPSAPAPTDEYHGAAEAIAGVGLAKAYGHVQALNDANISVHSGEVVALFGDNGAGKSTFLKTLLGMVHPDAGTVRIGGRAVELNSIRDAQALGVEAVHQDLSLAHELSVVDNMFLARQESVSAPLGRLFGVVDRKRMTEQADAALGDLGIQLPSLRTRVGDLSGGQRQGVAIARAVMRAETAILMDEPTAALGARQSEIVCALMRRVADRGLGVLVVSHDLPRVLATVDRVVILWRGSTVFDGRAQGLTVPEVVATMVGFQKEAAA